MLGGLIGGLWGAPGGPLSTTPRGCGGAGGAGLAARAAPAASARDEQATLEEENVTRGVVQWGWFAVAGIAESAASLALFRENHCTCEPQSTFLFYMALSWFWFLHCSPLSDVVVGLILLKRTLGRYGQHEDVSQWACHALCKLAEDPESARLLGGDQSSKRTRSQSYSQDRPPPTAASAPGEEDVCVVNELIQVLSCHTNHEDVLEECIAALGIIAAFEDNNHVVATINTKQSAQPGSTDASVYQPLYKAVSKHAKSESITEVAFQLISSICKTRTEECLLAIGECGLAKYLPAQLTKFGSNGSIAVTGTEAIAALCSVEGLAIKMANSYGAVAAVVYASGEHPFDAAVVNACLDALIAISRSDSGVLAKFRSENVALCLLQILRANMETQVTIVRKVLLHVVTLAEDDGCRDQFAANALVAGAATSSRGGGSGSGGGTDRSSIAEVVIQALMLNEADKEVCVLGFNALTVLCGGVLSLEYSHVRGNSPRTREGDGAGPSAASPDKATAQSSNLFFGLTKRSKESG
jgi:hypothetical protein